MAYYLGLRCSNTDFCHVILTGKSDSPRIEEKDQVSFPKGFNKQQSLKWFLQEIKKILRKYPVKVIAIKGTEGMAARGKRFVIRIEHEAMIYLAAANLGIKHVFKKVNNTIAKDLGLKGKGKYLFTKLDCSIFPDFERENDKMKDAIRVAWSSIK